MKKNDKYESGTWNALVSLLPGIRNVLNPIDQNLLYTEKDATLRIIEEY